MPDTRDDDLSRRELEKQIQDLKREKIRVEENIKRMETNQKRAEEMNAQRKAIEESKPEGEKDGDKEAEKDADDKEDDKDKEKGEKEDGEEGEKKEKKEVVRKRDDKGKDAKPPDRRSRALFGKMLGHLQSAKSRLETEKGWKATELNKKAQQKLEQKLTAQKMGIVELRREQFQIQMRDEEAKAVQIDKTIEEKELLLLQKRLESHYSLMMNFIRTKAEPTIFYLPSKHTSDTDKMLQETRSAIKHKIASLKVQLQPLPDDDSGEAAARASAAAAAVDAAERAEESKAGRDASCSEEPSIPPEAPKTAKEAEEMDEAARKREDEDDEKKSDEDGESKKRKKSDEDDDKSEKDDAKEAEEAKKDAGGEDKDKADEKPEKADADGEEPPAKKSKKDSDSE